MGADYFSMTSFRLGAAAIFGQDFRTALCAATNINFEHGFITIVIIIIIIIIVMHI